jgi:hypothetical protein
VATDRRVVETRLGRSARPERRRQDRAHLRPPSLARLSWCRIGQCNTRTERRALFEVEQNGLRGGERDRLWWGNAQSRENPLARQGEGSYDHQRLNAASESVASQLLTYDTTLRIRWTNTRQVATAHAAVHLPNRGSPHQPRLLKICSSRKLWAWYDIPCAPDDYR